MLLVTASMLLDRPQGNLRQTKLRRGAFPFCYLLEASSS